MARREDPERRGGSGGEEPDGVVLFDPDAWEPPETTPGRARRRRGGSRATLVLLGAVVIGGGGYWAYTEGIILAPPSEFPNPVQPVDPEMPAALPTLTPLVRGTLEGHVGTSLPLQVRARTGSTAPLVEARVGFQVVSGDGVVEPAESWTDAEGIARTSLALPSSVGTIVVLAALDDGGVQTQLMVNVRAGDPARISVMEGNRQQAQVGDLLPQRVAVVVHDATGIPVPGADVRFAVLAGGGVAAPSRSRTDSLGTASALWRLGPEAGQQSLSATALAIGEGVTFTASAAGLPQQLDGNPLPIEAGPVTVVRREFVVGGSHVCALESSVARCRGANDRGQRGVSGTAGFAALASGISHVCGLDINGEARCWGANEGGQLGDGSRTDRPSPVPVRTELRFSSLTAGAAHTCGLAGGGIPVCWGQNLNGQLGDGSRTDARFPRAVGGGLYYRTLVAGWNHTCGLSDSGNAFCWGRNSDGQLGDGSRIDRLVPALVRGAVETLTAGSAHTCGVSGDRVLCWGDNGFGQLGDGTTDGSPQPVDVLGLPSAARQVAAGAVHTCALLADGSAYCWGQNLQGQLGDGSRVNRSSAVAVEGGVRFRSLTAGGALTCGVSTEGAQYCWGFNQNGQLGDGTRESRSLPVRVAG